MEITQKVITFERMDSFFGTFSNHSSNITTQTNTIGRPTGRWQGLDMRIIQKKKEKNDLKKTYTLKKQRKKKVQSVWSLILRDFASRELWTNIYLYVLQK